MTHKETCNNSPLAPFNEALAMTGSPATRRRANKALLFAAIVSIYQIFLSEKGTLMSSDKAADSRAGAPAAKKPAEGQRFDLFRTFRHPPKPAEPFRAPRNADKPKE